MINAIIVDDEQPAILELEYLLKDYQEISIIDTFTSPKKVLSKIKDMIPQVVFLDIDMPEMDGIDLAVKLLKIKPNILIVFATAFEDYAIKAFDLNAVDYVLKPVDEERFSRTMNRIFKRLKKAEKAPDYEEVIKQLVKGKGKTKISVIHKDCIALLNPEEILYCMVEDGEVKVVTFKGKYYCEANLTKLENKLVHHNFFRSHRSYLVNMDFVEKIKPSFNNTYVILLEGEEEQIPVSRRHMKELKDQYML